MNLSLASGALHYILLPALYATSCTTRMQFASKKVTAVCIRQCILSSVRPGRSMVFYLCPILQYIQAPACQKPQHTMHQQHPVIACCDHVPCITILTPVWHQAKALLHHNLSSPSTAASLHLVVQVTGLCIPSHSQVKGRPIVVCFGSYLTCK